MCDVLKKVLKVIAVVAAVAAAAAAVYFLIKKLKAKKEPAGAADLESYVSCSCLDDEPIIVDEKPAEE
ncbi:MAG: hypothetical protein LBQ33_04225 [Oscillospiraceae bacterium]|jgi:hypothetical protein|nr:hypothetical protein [Oscillospiraceae bacterium]